MAAADHTSNVSEDLNGVGHAVKVLDDGLLFTAKLPQAEFNVVRLGQGRSVVLAGVGQVRGPLFPASFTSAALGRVSRTQMMLAHRCIPVIHFHVSSLGVRSAVAVS